MPGKIPTASEAERIRDAVMFFERSPRSTLDQPKKNVRERQVTPCTSQFRLILFGNPSGGSVSWTMTVTKGASTSAEAVTIDFDEDETDVKASLAAHSLVTTADVEFSSPGAGLPDQEIAFWFTNDILTSNVSFGTATNNLTGGWAPHPLLRLCCE